MFQQVAKAAKVQVTSLTTIKQMTKFLSAVVVVALLFYVHGKHLRSCRDGQLT